VCTHRKHTQFDVYFCGSGAVARVRQQSSFSAKSGGEEEDGNQTGEREVTKRGGDLQWFQKLVTQIPPEVLQKLVAHRGFHCTSDKIDRPIENTLEAYETAWTSGVLLCECDIALTKDEKIVLAHDGDFNRLALLKQLGRCLIFNRFQTSQPSFCRFFLLKLAFDVRCLSHVHTYEVLPAVRTRVLRVGVVTL
jgi:hypothetical protein